MNPLPYDPRCMDSDGLPHLGAGEQFYHASFEFIGESKFVEGVVAASDGSEAVSLLLNAAARQRGSHYSAMLPRALHPLSRKLTRDEALLLAPKVEHRVSMWKRSAEAALNTTGEFVFV